MDLDCSNYETQLWELFEDQSCYLSRLPFTIKSLLLQKITDHPLGIRFEQQLAILLYFKKDSTSWSSTRYFVWQLKPQLHNYSYYLQVVLDAPFFMCQVFQLLKASDIDLWFSTTPVKRKPFMVPPYFDYISWLLKLEYKIVIDSELKYEQTSLLGTWNHISHPNLLADLVVDIPQWILDGYKRIKRFTEYNLLHTYHSKLSDEDRMYVPFYKDGVLLNRFPPWIVKVYADRSE